jgi:hypothetical protein
MFSLEKFCETVEIAVYFAKYTAFSFQSTKQTKLTMIYRGMLLNMRHFHPNYLTYLGCVN